MTKGDVPKVLSVSSLGARYEEAQKSPKYEVECAKVFLDAIAALEASERVIESQRLTIKALTDGCERYGLDGTTPVVRHIAALETSLEASERRCVQLRVALLKLEDHFDAMDAIKDAALRGDPNGP